MGPCYTLKNMRCNITWSLYTDEAEFLALNCLTDPVLSPPPKVLISSFIWSYGMKSSSFLWLLSVREPLQFLLANLPSSGVLLQWPEVQLDFTSGNSSKENSNNFNLMGDMSGKKITTSNPVLTCGGKPARGYFHQKAWKLFNEWGREEEARPRRDEGKEMWFFAKASF